MDRIAAVLRGLFALGVATAVLVAGPVAASSALDRAAGLVAFGHSQLVSSSPGSGDTLTAPPTEIRLVFSEPIDPRYTSLDLVDGTGRAILVGAGAPDPSDGRILVAPIPPAPICPPTPCSRSTGGRYRPPTATPPRVS